MQRPYLPARQHPGWNWKTALLSASGRAAVFGLGVMHSGGAPTLRMLMVEVLLAALIGGFQGGLLQAMRAIEPVWSGNLLAIAATGLIVHPAEYILHRMVGDSGVQSGIASSFLYTILASQCTLHLMRKGRLLAGSPRLTNSSSGSGTIQHY